MKRYWVYFRGTNNGMHIVENSVKAAKTIFAFHHGIPANSAYIAARRDEVYR